ncbi:HK97-gp10 family putative phage morphogenesis protein [Halorussus halobius]|uniref:HK97-gp10 family putative phage morphogenesis protein n=1 Tax=Halorussus halobius TaxID=1710537 RepID=UPI001092ADD6|nr:HK97-gp10 family putative phage morphogenesis protein [Halorussus halobius]
MDANLDFESGFAPEDAQEAFESMVAEADDKLMERMEEGEQNIQKEAQQRSPVDTGNLRASWTGLTEARRGTIITEVGNTADYAEHVEKGTSKMAAQPMLRPAMDREQMALIRDIEELVYRVAAQEGNA